MAEGTVLFEGTSDEVKKNEKVIESYFGKKKDSRRGKNLWDFLKEKKDWWLWKWAQHNQFLAY
jgi:Uncharacterized ABC-type transport system, ATPase component